MDGHRGKFLQRAVMAEHWKGWKEGLPLTFVEPGDKPVGLKRAVLVEYLTANLCIVVFMRSRRDWRSFEASRRQGSNCRSSGCIDRLGSCKGSFVIKMVICDVLIIVKLKPLISSIHFLDILDSPIKV